MSLDTEDFELLRDYVANRSEPAFRALVERHVDMVYATALRQAGAAHLAEEATQSVFITLAKKAHGLAPSTVLAGWLFRAAHFAGAKVQRAELRRKHWEQQAAQMEPNPADSAAAWEQMAPHLNEALNELKEPDRDALILRFFESKSMAQVGGALGITEGAAKMRIARALEQLRGIFQARGIALPLVLLTSALSASAAQAAPNGLAASITTSVFLKTTTIPLLTKGLLLFMNWNTRKLAITAITVLVLSTGATTIVAYHFWNQRPVTPVPLAQAPGEPALQLVAEGEAAVLEVTPRPARGGTLRLVTPDGDVITTNGASHMVVVDAEGRTNSVTVSTAFTGGGRGARRVSVRATAGGPARVPGGFGSGAGGAGGVGPGPGISGEAGGGVKIVEPAPEVRTLTPK